MPAPISKSPLRDVSLPDRPTGEGRAVFSRRTREHLDAVERLLGELSEERIAEFAEILDEARRSGATIFVLGNGGSAATAIHMSCDLAIAREPSRDQGALRVICLNGNMSLFSALSNDHGYDHVFTRQLDALLRPGDVVVAISASGNSPNCVRALELARIRGAVGLALLGFDGGQMMDLCEAYIHVSSHDHREVEDVHLAVAHSLALCLRIS